MGGSVSTAKVGDSMSHYAGLWNSRDVKGSQTELFWNIVSNEPEDFSEKFKDNHPSET